MREAESWQGRRAWGAGVACALALAPACQRDAELGPADAGPGATVLVASPPSGPPSGLPSAPAAVASAAPTASVSSAALAAPDAPQHAPTQEALEALVGPLPAGAGGRRGETDAAWLKRLFGLGGPGKTHQGDPKLAKHSIGRAECLKGLEGVRLTEPWQEQLCGAPNMVPVWTPKEGRDGARVCIDLFEFPNRACELPFVWVGPTPAREVCERLGKRLCTQSEWVLACSGDPAGGPPQRFAYGEELDLTACNTNKRARDHSPRCNARTIDAAYATCGTNTEPSGAFPRCRSRFGAFDFHGNVAEIMTRWEESDQQTVSQLKGSAFFYVDVVPKKGKERARETYSDHCAHDPRWHVEPMKKAWHVNYHLGFRCCRDVPGAGKPSPP